MTAPGPFSILNLSHVPGGASHRPWGPGKGGTPELSLASSHWGQLPIAPRPLHLKRWKWGRQHAHWRISPIQKRWLQQTCSKGKHVEAHGGPLGQDDRKDVPLLLASSYSLSLDVTIRTWWASLSLLLHHSITVSQIVTNILPKGMLFFGQKGPSILFRRSPMHTEISNMIFQQYILCCWCQNCR